MTTHVTKEDIRGALASGTPLTFERRKAEKPAARRARSLPAGWITSLAEEPDRDLRIPLRISGAVILGALSLRHATFDFEVEIIDCEFVEHVDLSFATFRRGVRMDGSSFAMGASMRGANANGDLTIRRATFGASANFDEVHVANSLDATDARFAGLSLEHCDVGTKLLLVGVHCAGPTSLRDGRIRGAAELSGATFADEFTFNRAEIDDYLFCAPDGARSAASFEGRARFHDLRVGGFLTATGTTFAKTATFDGLRVGSTVIFRGAIFKGDALFQRMQAGDDVIFADDENGKSAVIAGRASLSDSDLAGKVQLSGAQLNGPVFFNGAKIGGDFDCEPTERGDPTCFSGNASFLSARISGYAKFDRAVFGGNALFVRTDFAEAAFFADSKFNGVASFILARFRSNADFRRVAFMGDVEFQGAQFEGEASLDSARFSGRCSFEAARFGRMARVLITNAIFDDDVDFRGAVAEQKVEFWGTTFAGNATFFEAQFHAVYLHNGPLETRLVGDVDLRGFEYDLTDALGADLLSRLAPYDPQPYLQLERVFRASGMQSRADAVYLVGRSRERAEYFKQRDWGRLFRSYAYWLVARYGVKPYRLWVMLGVLLLVGSVLFSQPGAVSPASTSASAAVARGIQGLSPMEAFEISLHALLPIAVPAGGGWRPSANCVMKPLGLCFSFADYATLQSLAGWILIPLLVASLTGLLFRRPGQSG